jgi:hypothetical protein
MLRRGDVLTKPPVRDELVADQLLQRLEREPLVEEQQGSDDHRIPRRAHVPAHGVLTREALGLL